MNPEKVIQKQVEAYNSRDLSAFLDCHHPEVQLYNFSEQVPFAVGLPSVRKIYGAVFDTSPNLNTEILHRILLDNKVIDHEIVTGRSGVERLEIIAIYEVQDDKIRKAHFIRQ